MEFSKPFEKAFKKVQAALQVYKNSNNPTDLILAQQLFRKLMLDLGHVERVKNLYKVYDKQSGMPKWFRPNPAQLNVLLHCSKNNRSIVLKSRQLGITTLSCIRGLDLAMFEPGKSCGILAHNREAVTNIFNDKVRVIYQHFIEDWQGLYKPQTKFDSKNELFFESDNLGNSLNSKIRVATSFRSGTVHFLHSSETAFTEEGNLLGSLKCVPEAGEMVSESTPQGRGGWFYNTWAQYKASKGNSGFQGIFLPWQEYYPEPGTEHYYEPNDHMEYSNYERNLLDQDIKPSQIIWRRRCIEVNCNGSEEDFDAEYPTDDVSCFLAGQDNFFPTSMLVKLEAKAREPKQVGFLQSEGNKIIFDEDSRLGIFYIWEFPKITADYAIGADPGGGLGKDNSCAYVIDRESGAIVAKCFGQIEPVTFADQIYKLMKFYNNAWVNVEVNNHGLTVIERLKTIGPVKFYRRKVTDTLTDKLTTRIGFQTTNDSKLKITDNLKSACRDGSIRIYDQSLINEMSTFLQVSGKTGRGLRREAASGCHDDMVMAICLTWEMNRILPKSDFDEKIDYQPAGEIDPDTGFLM